MENKENLFAEELQKTLYWISRNRRTWNDINGFGECTISVEEMSKVVDKLIEEKMYIPLVMFLANDFVGYHNAEMIRRILVDTLISQWNEETWNTAMNVIKESIAEYLDEQKETSIE